jgi:hypothetical protein
MSKVTVYRFMGYDIASGEMVRSKAMATLEWINKRGYVALIETAKGVETAALDAIGLYRESPPR